MKIMVIGCGMMGRALIRDILKHGRPEILIAADRDASQIRAAQTFVRDMKPRTLVTKQIDIQNPEQLEPLMKKVDTVVSAVTYRYNLELAQAAVRNGCHFCDLGGNNSIVRRQLALNKAALKKGVTVIPDCGLAPGLVSVLTAHAVSRMERTDDVQLRVGGLPVKPKPPMNYRIVFSVLGLINEYVEPCIQLQNGKTIITEPMKDLESIRFPAPFGVLEAFNTSGGASTLPETYKNKIRNLDYKTIRYPGHCAQIRLLMDLGLTETKPEKYGVCTIPPREILAHHLQKTLGGEGDDCILLRVTAQGVRNGKPCAITYECVDYGEKENGISAMMRMTAYPASIIAQMMSSGVIMRAGALPQEIIVPPDLFIAEIRKRGIGLKIKIR